MCFNVLLHFSWIFIFIHRGSSVHEPSICCLLIFCYSPCLCLQRKCCRYCYVLPSPIFWKTLWFFAGKFIAITIKHKFKYFSVRYSLIRSADQSNICVGEVHIISKRQYSTIIYWNWYNLACRYFISLFAKIEKFEQYKNFNVRWSWKLSRQQNTRFKRQLAC